MLNFHYISVLLDILYGVELEDQDVEEYGLIAWEKIGNKNTKLYKVSLCIDPFDNSITLPCNAIDENGDSLVELVTASYEDWERVTNKTIHGDLNSNFVEHSIETEKYFLSPYYLPGKVLEYELVKNKLYFTHNYGKVNVLYKGFLCDEEGLPEITDKEANAIATFIAYIVKFKEGLKTNNPDTIKVANTLNEIWLKLCDLARIKYLNLNDFDAILEASSSWDRKRYGKGIKIIK